ncbi:MAG TPA: YciI family protein [Acidimicrobiia bacterium]|nr:YciI family protein [Acidimicrobiia bacterium]
MLMIWSDPTPYTTLSGPEQGSLMNDYYAFTQSIIDSKEHVGGDPLQGVDTATTVRVRNGEVLATDGPFTETKEVLGGYYIVDVADLDRATELAAQLPGAKRGFDTIEVRPLMQLPEEFNH